MSGVSQSKMDWGVCAQNPTRASCNALVDKSMSAAVRLPPVLLSSTSTSFNTSIETRNRSQPVITVHKRSSLVCIPTSSIKHRSTDAAGQLSRQVTIIEEVPDTNCAEEEKVVACVSAQSNESCMQPTTKHERALRVARTLPPKHSKDNTTGAAISSTQRSRAVPDAGNRQGRALSVFRTQMYPYPERMLSNQCGIFDNRIDSHKQGAKDTDAKPNESTTTETPSSLSSKLSRIINTQKEHCRIIQALEDEQATLPNVAHMEKGQAVLLRYLDNNVTTKHLTCQTVDGATLEKSIQELTDYERLISRHMDQLLKKEQDVYERRKKLIERELRRKMGQQIAEGAQIESARMKKELKVLSPSKYLASNAQKYRKPARACT